MTSEIEKLLANFSMKDVVFFRAEGNKSENAVLKGGIDEDTGELMFFELLGLSSEVGKMLVNGKETYKRIFIRRVYPYLQLQFKEQKGK